MTGPTEGTDERRRRPPAPAKLDKSKKWPRANFADVSDPALRDACLHAQTLALVLLRGMGARRWSARGVAKQAGVDIDQVNGVLDGKAWPQPYTVHRLLRAVGAHLEVVEEELDGA